jgi:hypothetical protein
MEAASGFTYIAPEDVAEEFTIGMLPLHSI